MTLCFVLQTAKMTAARTNKRNSLVPALDVVAHMNGTFHMRNTMRGNDYLSNAFTLGYQVEPLSRHHIAAISAAIQLADVLTLRNAGSACLGNRLVRPSMVTRATTRQRPGATGRTITETGMPCFRIPS